MINEVRNIAMFYHGAQKYGTKPYVSHLDEVFLETKFLGGDIVAQLAALLHDVLEDTKATPQELKDLGIPREVIEIVSILTHIGDRQTYIATVKQHPIARLVKIADTKCNLRHSLREHNERRIKKYCKQLEYLL